MLSIDVKKYLQGVSVSEDYGTNFDTLSVFSSELERLNISDCIYRIFHIFGCGIKKIYKLRMVIKI